MFFGDQWITQTVVFVTVFNNRARHLRALFNSQTFGNGSCCIVAHNYLKRDDFAFPHQLFPHIQAFNEVCRDTDCLQTVHEKFRQTVVQNTLAVDHIFLFGIECGGLIFEVLNDGSRLRSIV